MPFAASGGETPQHARAITVPGYGMDSMVNTTLWLLLTCASACTALSAFLPPPAARMWRIDILELRRRRRLIEVLTANTRSASPELSSPTPPGDGTAML
jgi:hypothetical protein